MIEMYRIVNYSALLCGELCDSEGVEIPLARKGLPPGHSLSFFSGLGFRIWLEAPIGGALDYMQWFSLHSKHTWR